MDATTAKRSAVFGTLSLVAFCAAILIGIGVTVPIPLHSEGMMPIVEAIAKRGFGFIACVVSLILALVGVVREEKPLWPAVVGFLLSILPGGIGFWILFLLVR